MLNEIIETETVGKTLHIVQLLYILEGDRSTVDGPDDGLGTTSHPSRGVEKDDKGYDGDARDDNQQGFLPFTKGVEHIRI